jgi:hypothetical protein
MADVHRPVLQAHRSNHVSYPVNELNRLAANLTAAGLLVDNKPRQRRCRLRCNGAELPVPGSI